MEDSTTIQLQVTTNVTESTTRPYQGVFANATTQEDELTTSVNRLTTQEDEMTTKEEATTTSLVTTVIPGEREFDSH